MDAWRGASVPTLPGRGSEPFVRDTATGELVQAATGHRATMYACGITPYDATHLGHAATFLAWDLLVRAWLDAGYEVVYVQNVTDVDDPLLERAGRDGQDWRALADREIAGYRSDMQALRVLPPARLVGAVEALPVIDRFSRALAYRSALYDLDNDVYFCRGSDARFGSVSGLDQAAMLELSAERGGDPARPGKKDPLDCLVWLGARPGEPSWDSSFGRGRPGWHVECAAIATEYLGTTFDVQAGGSDLIFPHHEMSASHARVAAGEEAAFARRYVHAGMVRLDGEKMSKSRGNLVFVARLLAGAADPMAIRLAVLAHHYRADWDWTAAGLDAAERRLQRWRAAVRRGLAAERSAEDRGATAAAWAGSPAGRAEPAAGEAARSLAAGGEDAGRQAGDRASGAGVLAAVRERVADDLDAAGALTAIDRWADAVLAAPDLAPGTGAALVRDTADALLGVEI